VRDVTSSNFGLLIAYVIPGFVAVWGLSALIPEIKLLLLARGTDQPTIGGFLYLTLAAVGTGTFVSTVRWMLIDTLHHATGLRRSQWDFSGFHETGRAYARLNDLHYLHYQFHSNSLVAVAFAYLTHRLTEGGRAGLTLATDAAVFVVLVVLFLGSRDTLRKYFERLDQLLAARHPTTAAKLTTEMP